MPIHAGVWIDHRQAIVALLADGKRSTEIIESHTQKPPKTSGGSHQREPWAHQMVAAQDHLDREHRQKLGRFYDAVESAIASAEDLYLMGSGQARKELLNHMRERDRVAIRVRESTAAKAMSEAEVLAETCRFYHLPVQEAS